jgi:hypothetical protein
MHLARLELEAGGRGFEVSGTQLDGHWEWLSDRIVIGSSGPKPYHSDSLASACFSRHCNRLWLSLAVAWCRSLTQNVPYRGADFSIVWPRILATAIIGAVYFAFALRRFRRVIFGG